ncbi:MAG: transaldolase [Phycisphaerae bacterium]|nr:transaldolase [Phycisphaerae bacterium]
MTNRIEQIWALGQAIWYDNISRELLQSGGLQELVERGVAGVTSNPSIFQKSIAKGVEYDEQIRELAIAGKSAFEIYEALALRDIGQAADLLRPVFNETHGRDGFVSLEVRPSLAHDTAGTIEEGRRLFHFLHRPNVMIKVPATEAGLPAISTLIGEGINVNVTLIFSVPMYERVIDAYLEGLRRFGKTGRPLATVSSVASFFVSRIDTLTDSLLEERIQKGQDHLDELLGKAAVASAKIAYLKYKEIFEGERFVPFRADGARPQRALWASTSTKNPAYPDTKYVDTLIGVNTVNTVPPDTLEAVCDHGVVAQTIEQDAEGAFVAIRRLREFAGIEINAVAAQLLNEGVDAFAGAFDKLLSVIETKRIQFAPAARSA